jgi:hypothetical protein
VVVGCGELTRDEAERALASGAAEAERFIAEGLIHRAGLFLKDYGRIVDGLAGDTTDMPLLETKRYA